MPFSFKGIDHEPSCVIDLDTFILGNQGIESVFHIVASHNNIGNYSYEYEVLESSVKIFSEPTGIAHEFICDEGFDLEGFKSKQNEQSVFEKLQSIASEALNINDLANNKDIQKALLRAYQIGLDTSKEK
ncbi:MAG: hypothetical protein V3U84_00340 [Thiotrichaceae bacterium]